MTNWRTIKQELSGKSIAQKVTNPLRELVFELQPRSNTVANYNELLAFLLEVEDLYFRRIFNASDVPEDIRTADLANTLGRAGSLQHLLPRAVDGLQGGLSGIILEFIEAKERELTRAHVAHVTADIDPGDYDTIIALMQSLLAEAGHLLEKPQSPALLSMRWQEVLYEYAQAASHLNSKFGRY